MSNLSSDENVTEALTKMSLIEPMLRHFRFAHLRSEGMRDISKRYAMIATLLVGTVPSSAERTVALRKLIESKDCAVRCVIDVEDARKAAG